MLINLKHTNKLLNSMLTKTQRDNNGNITIHPTLNAIWKHILLTYWPKFAINSNTIAINNCKDQIKQSLFERSSSKFLFLETLTNSLKSFVNSPII